MDVSELAVLAESAGCLASENQAALSGCIERSAGPRLANDGVHADASLNPHTQVRLYDTDVVRRVSWRLPLKQRSHVHQRTVTELLAPVQPHGELVCNLSEQRLRVLVLRR